MQQKIISLAVFLALSAGIWAQSKKENEVLSRVKMFNDAVFINKDSLALEGLMADDVSYGHSGGKLEDRKQMISNAIHSRTSYTGFEMDSFTVFFEDNVAVVRHVLRAQSDDRGTKSVLHLGVLQIWVKDDRQWKLMARQSVKL